MKQKVSRIIEVCDLCRADCDGMEYECIACGQVLCFDCSSKHGVKYQHGVHFSGSGDGFYCKTCDTMRLRNYPDKLHAAYVAIQKLRAEEEAWHNDFDVRRSFAEREVKRLNGKQRTK